MHKIKPATCSCTQKFCGHENELMCSKPLSQQATDELHRERENFADYRLGLCDECFANMKKHLPQLVTG